MKLKARDKLFCKKDYCKKDYKLYTIGNKYQINYIYGGDNMYSLSNDFGIGSSTHFSFDKLCEYFYTEKELRKMKLNEIESR